MAKDKKIIFKEGANSAVNFTENIGMKAKTLGDIACYDSLSLVFQKALEQASEGKGAERHATDGQKFEDQLICDINRRLGSIDGQLFQGIKKAYEVKRLLQISGKDAAEKELLGAINYLAAAVILLKEEK